VTFPAHGAGAVPSGCATARIHTPAWYPASSIRNGWCRYARPAIPPRPAAGTWPRPLAGQRWLGFPPRSGARDEPYALALQQLLAAHGLGAAEIVPVDSLTA
jgi:hypothetical protein